MSNKDVAFALELVAKAIGEQVWGCGPEKVTQESLSRAVWEIARMAEVLRAAPEQPNEFVETCVSEDDGPCLYHPLGGPNCAM